MSLLPCLLGCLFNVRSYWRWCRRMIWIEKKYSIDAWRTITQMGKDEYLLMYRSSKYDGRLGSVAKYVYMRLCELDNSTQAARIRFMHSDSRSAFLVGLTQLATVPRSPENETKHHPLQQR
uniref:Uncharacterized protein n=1 Tax=Ixodes ricinus TaxID=34613 RepID=V5H5L4_IXORI